MQRNGNAAMPASLPWLVPIGTLAQQQKHLLTSGLMSDCTVVVGAANGPNRQTFHCHKLMLCKSSQVFYFMFHGELAERDEIVIDDIEPRHFSKMLEFIYTDTVELEDVETALGVYYVAHKYVITMLHIKCVTYIMENVAAPNVCQALELARLLDNQQLEKICIEYIKSYTGAVLAAENFKLANRETLITILNFEELSVNSELALFLACVRWAEAHVQEGYTLRDTLGPEVISLIHFLSMSPTDFANKVCPSKILTNAEENDILRCMITESTVMPTGFSHNTNTRGLCYTKHLQLLLFNVNSSGNVHQADSNGNWTLTFTLNSNVIIHGFVIYAWKSNQKSSYYESVEIVLNQENQNLATLKFEGQVLYGSYFNIFLDKALTINAGKYELFLLYASPESQYNSTYLENAGYVLNSGVQFTNVNGCTQICCLLLTC